VLVVLGTAFKFDLPWFLTYLVSGHGCCVEIPTSELSLDLGYNFKPERAGLIAVLVSGCCIATRLSTWVQPIMPLAQLNHEIIWFCHEAQSLRKLLLRECVPDSSCRLILETETATNPVPSVDS
jgi:hypothetical protein